jgi:predicted 2-oxoglutarate/Fe(II)-dependent dioxygenase YbiX
MAVRNTWEVPVADDAMAGVSAKLEALRPDLAAHFGADLTGHEGPTILLYQPGGFYEPHVDRSRRDELDIRPVHRRVSVVVFLNAMRVPAGPAEYSGGALTFYGLIDEPAWKSIGFGLEPEAGLLVAFPSDIVHEVTPVIAGDRYTIVDWFTA